MDGNFSGDRPPPHPPALPDRRPARPHRSSSRPIADLRGQRAGQPPHLRSPYPGVFCVSTTTRRPAPEHQAAETSKDADAAETSKDADDRKVARPWNIINIRLPPKKSLPDASLILSNKVPENTANTASMEVPEPITENPGKNLITAPVQGESDNAGKTLSAESDSDTSESESDTSGNKLLDEVNVSTWSNNLRVTAEGKGSDADSYAAKQEFCEGANNNNPNMIFHLPVQELPEDHSTDSSPSKNHETAGKQGEEECNNSPRNKVLYNTESKLAAEEGDSPDWNKTITAVKYEEVFEGTNHAISTKPSDEIISSAPSIGPADLANESTPHKGLTSSLQATGTSQNQQAVEQSINAASMKVMNVYQEFEKKAKPSVYLDILTHHATEAETNPSRTLSTTASQSDASGDKLPNVANDSTLSKNLGVAVEEQGSDASSYAGLSEEANNNIPSMIIPLPDQELPEDHIDNGPSKNLTMTGKQGKDEHDKSQRKKLLYDNDIKVEDEEGNYPSWKRTNIAVKYEKVKYEKVFAEAIHPIPCKKLSDDAKNNCPSNRPSDLAKSKPVYKRRRTSSVQATGTSQNTPGMRLSASVGQTAEESTDAASMEDINVYQEFEEKVKRNEYLDNLLHQALEAKTNPSRTLSTTATQCGVFEHANHTIPTNKLSDVARYKARTYRPTDPAKKNAPRKKPRTSAVQATGTSQITSAKKVSTADRQAVEPSKSAADLEAIKQYQEFEEKVKRTVYLDNLSHQATEEVIKAALSQFCTIRKISFVVNYTIPYNIPQSAFVEMETVKDAEAVVSMLQDFPFMMSGMPRPVRAIHATAEMFNDRPRRPGSKLEFRWVRYPDHDYEVVKKLKLLSRKHEVENFALIEHELEEEKLLAAEQQKNLNCNYKMMETMDSVLMSGMSNYISSCYNVSWNDMF